jgi:hypothetical protein
MVKMQKNSRKQVFSLQCAPMPQNILFLPQRSTTCFFGRSTVMKQLRKQRKEKRDPWESLSCQKAADANGLSSHPYHERGEGVWRYVHQKTVLPSLQAYLFDLCFIFLTIFREVIVYLPFFRYKTTNIETMGSSRGRTVFLYLGEEFYGRSDDPVAGYHHGI